MTNKIKPVALDCNGIELEDGNKIRDIRSGEIFIVRIIMDDNLINIVDEYMQYVRYSMRSYKYERIIPESPIEFKDWIAV